MITIIDEINKGITRNNLVLEVFHNRSDLIKIKEPWYRNSLLFLPHAYCITDLPLKKEFIAYFIKFYSDHYRFWDGILGYSFSETPFISIEEQISLFRDVYQWEDFEESLLPLYLNIDNIPRNPSGLRFIAPLLLQENLSGDILGFLREVQETMNPLIMMKKDNRELIFMLFNYLQLSRYRSDQKSVLAICNLLNTFG